jgi:hypothetical protein
LVVVVYPVRCPNQTTIHSRQDYRVGAVVKAVISVISHHSPHDDVVNAQCRYCENRHHLLNHIITERDDKLD